MGYICYGFVSPPLPRLLSLVSCLRIKHHASRKQTNILNIPKIRSTAPTPALALAPLDPHRYLWNPYTILTCLARSTTTLENSVLLWAIASVMTSGKISLPIGPFHLLSILKHLSSEIPPQSKKEELLKANIFLFFFFFLFLLLLPTPPICCQ